MGSEQSNPLDNNNSKSIVKACTPGMKIAVLGSGKVGQTLADAFIEEGHYVILGSRKENDEKALEWVKSKTKLDNNNNNLASIGDYTKAVKESDIILIVTAGTAGVSAIEMAGGDAAFANKVVIDTTNPIDEKFTLIGSAGSGGGDLIQKAIPSAFVVKAFNTVGYENMYKPKVLIPGVKPTMFICGNSAEAKQKVSNIINDFGWETMDVGGIDSSHYLESMCLVWIKTAIMGKNRNQAFAMLPTSAAPAT